MPSHKMSNRALYFWFQPIIAKSPQGDTIRLNNEHQHEAFENVVATFVDIASIMVAYFVGIHQFNFIVGLAYAFFDAVLVVWMRKPLTRLVRNVLAIRNGRSSQRDTYVADLA